MRDRTSISNFRAAPLFKAYPALPRRKDLLKPRLWLVSALVCALFGASLAAAPAAEADRIKGIDISMHQGKINWRKIPDRIRFAFAKATEGQDYVDPRYYRNRRAAGRQRIKFGAYHFARPSGRGRRAVRRDASREARDFVRAADLRGRHMLPVLDLEVSDGLGERALKRWTRRWLEEVRERVGVKGMIYTSPFFWRTEMGNTQWFAEHGYRALWIAHWETRRPDIPAGNWDGEGWTFWQYTSCGRVRGIDGCVDKNKYRYRSLGRVTIRRNHPSRDARKPKLIDLPLP